MKFTFKINRPTGKWKSFDYTTVDVKLDGKRVGTISENRIYSTQWKISFHIEKKDIMEDGNPNCTWRNIFLANKFSSIEEAKNWLNENIDTLMKKYALHKLD